MPPETEFEPMISLDRARPPQRIFATDIDLGEHPGRRRTEIAHLRDRPAQEVRSRAPQLRQVILVGLAGLRTKGAATR